MREDESVSEMQTYVLQQVAIVGPNMSLHFGWFCQRWIM